jgi:hypothetical protein
MHILVMNGANGFEVACATSSEQLKARARNIKGDWGAVLESVEPKALLVINTDGQYIAIDIHIDGVENIFRSFCFDAIIPFSEDDIRTSETGNLIERP